MVRLASRKHKLLPLLTIIGIAAIGVYLLASLHAASPTVSIEPENGTIAAPATIVSDSTASNGKAIKFNTATHTAVCGWGGSPGTYKHVVWIWMENKDQTVVIGKAPYIDSVKAACGSATNVQDSATSVGLPSEPEYAAGTSGSNCDTGINTTGTNCIVTDNDYGSANSLTTTSIFQLVKNSGGTWKGYQESMPSNCALSSSGAYVYKHNPAAFYSNMHTDCTANDVGFPGISCNASASAACSTPSGSFYNDIKTGSLPTFSFVTPNLDNDMHDGTIIQADNWLSTYLPIITAGPNYQAGNTAVFLMWDEGSSNGGSSTTDIPSLVLSPAIKPGAVTALQTNDVGLLRTTQEMLGLTPYLGCASGMPPGGVGGCSAGSDVSIRSALGL